MLQEIEYVQVGLCEVWQMCESDKQKYTHLQFIV